METCNHECSGCSESDCSEREDFEKLLEGSKIGTVIAIVSGKGGVGKSLVTSLLAVMMQRAGHKVGILDADVTGPSIPKAFGLKGRVRGDQRGMLPMETETGIEVMSVNLLLEHDTDPVIWRGPVIGNTVKQFWTDVVWGELDYLFIDMPPGTGDVPLTVFQSIPVDKIVVVTSPQELVSMIVAKAVKMAEMMNIPVLGLVENMSYFHCPDNDKDYAIFGDSHIDDTARSYNLDVLAKLPIDPKLAAACDAGAIEHFEVSELLDEIIEKMERASEKTEER